MAEWWRGGVIYQIYPRSFCDTNADGIGDLSGIIDRIDYIAGLGVDGIWLSPFFTSPMKDFGYDVADYCGVDPMFGTIVDFEGLLKIAHGLGLKVIIDQVYSHSSDAHPWFAESRQSRDNSKADWYVWAEPKPDGTPPNNWLAVFGGAAWSWEPRRRQYYLHNFLPEQPDLNFHHRDVQDAVLEAAEFWLKLGVDGFRIDVANFFAHDPLLRDNPPAYHPAPDKPLWLQRPIYNRTRPETLPFVARFRALLDRYPERMAVAEIAAEDQIAAMVEYTDGPDRYHTAYSFVFLKDAPTPRAIREGVERMLSGSASAWPSWSFSNHDVIRVISRCTDAREGNDALAKLLIAVLGCLRGTAFLYQGEELGLPHGEVPFDRLQDPEGKTFWPRHKGRDGARTPMPWRVDEPFAGFSTVEPWLPVDLDQARRAVDRQRDDPTSVLNFTRQFLAWRKGHPALISGDIRFSDSPENVLLFERSLPRERLLCAFNFSDQETACDLNLDGTFRELPGYGLSGRLEANRAILAPFGGIIVLGH
ncbi:MAG: alpha-glucosidase [Hyphomicrobiales bacterium]|nr:alpha-glucosidase [Hyphomicrobiales bacterium]